MSLALSLGILANIIFIVSGLFRLPKHAIKLAVAGNMTYILYYFVIGLYAPIISVGIGALSCLLILKAQNNVTIKKVAFVTAIATSFLIIHSMSGWHDMFLILAAWCICLANINRENYIPYKGFVIISQAFWISYCLIMSEYAMLTTCAFILISNSSSLFYNLRKDRLSNTQLIVS